MPGLQKNLLWVAEELHESGNAAVDQLACPHQAAGGRPLTVLVFVCVPLLTSSDHLTSSCSFADLLRPPSLMALSALLSSALLSLSPASSSLHSALAQGCSSLPACASLVHAGAALFPAKLRAGAEAAGAALLAARSPATWPAASELAAAQSKDSTYCPNNGAFDLVPLTVANVSSGAASAVWGGDGCFGQVSASISWGASGGVSIKLTGSSPTKLLCSDVYLVATSLSLSLPVELSTLAPSGSTGFASWGGGAEEAADVALNGVHIGLLPCGITGSLASALATLNIFSPLSGNISDLVQSNTAFLNGRSVWNGPGGLGSPLVPYGQQQRLANASLRSGDYLAILRFDGLDPMIGFGTGFGGTGHSAVLLWQGSGSERQLFVVEATDIDPFGPAVVFGRGIIKTPWEQWQQLAHEAAYNVAVLPLQPQLSAAFDEAAAWQWFEGPQGVVGQSYGYR